MLPDLSLMAWLSSDLNAVVIMVPYAQGEKKYRDCDHNCRLVKKLIISWDDYTLTVI